MKTYKIKATMTIDVEQEIYADSEDEARSKFFEQSVSETVDDASCIEEIDTTVEEIYLSEGTFVVKVSDIQYDVDYNTCYDIVLDSKPELEDSLDLDRIIEAKRKEILSELPTEYTLEISCEKDDLDDYVLDEITEKSGWLIMSFSHEIIEVK